MILCFDTETTGLPIKKVGSDHPLQPHLVQLALVSYDDAGQEIEGQCVIIKPDGWEIPDEEIALHGISHERAMAEGIPESEAVALYVAAAEGATIRVAHNEAFDSRIMRIAMVRSGMERKKIEAIEARSKFCTCEAAKLIVNLPPTRRMLDYGFTGPKPPKLEECMKHFFEEGLPGAHDAMVDVRACARVYFHLLDRQKAKHGEVV